MAVVENRFVCDLSKPVQAQALKGNVFSLDNLGSRLSVLIYNNGQPATISGSITANCILPDGSTVNVNGGLTTENGGSKAYVDIPQSCLLIPGILKIAIKCTSSVITTLAAIVANVYMTKTDNVITPSQQIINDWNAEISAAIATQNAAIANQDTKINDLKSAMNAEDARIVGLVNNEHDRAVEAENNKINKPATNPNGAPGQLLRTLGNGQTEWATFGLPTDEQTAEAVTTWLNDHPEATTTVQDNSITEAKLVNALKTKVNKFQWETNRIFDQSDYIKTLTNNSADVSILQGVAYNSTNNKYVIAVVSSDGYSKCMLVEISTLDYITVTNRVLIEDEKLGHANDITYNPNTNKYYVITGDQGTYKNKIAIVDGDTLAFEDHISLYGEEDECNWVVAYDGTNDKYITASYSHIQEYSSNWEFIKEVDYSVPQVNIGTNKANPYIQCGTMLNDNFVMLLITGASYDIYNCITAIVETSNYQIIEYENIESFNFYDEPEGVFEKDGTLFVIGGQAYYTVKQLIPDNKPAAIGGNDVFTAGKRISVNGFDLNTLVSPGKYFANYGPSTHFVNGPSLSSNCCIYVFSQASQYVIQLIIPTNNTMLIHYRLYNADEKSWKPWQRIKPFEQPTASSVSAPNETGWSTGAYKRIRIKDGVVFMQAGMSFSGTYSENTWNTIFTLSDSAAFPVNNIDFLGIQDISNTPCRMRINTSGKVQVYGTTGLETTIRFTLTYATF